MVEKGRGKSNPPIRRIVLVVKSDKRRDRPQIRAKSRARVFCWDKFNYEFVEQQVYGNPFRNTVYFENH